MGSIIKNGNMALLFLSTNVWTAYDVQYRSFILHNHSEITLNSCDLWNCRHLKVTSILRTSLGVLPSTLMLLTSTTSSPTCMSPERSAAPPCITLAITIFPVSSSVLIVAPCRNTFILPSNLNWMLPLLKDTQNINFFFKQSEC